MTKTVRTPGTWVPVLHSSGQFSIGASTKPGCWPKGRICDLIQGTEADAHIIAAAPDLLDLMRSAVARIEQANAEGNPILSAWLTDARAAIAKATGE